MMPGAPGDFDRPVFLVLFPIAFGVLLLASRKSLTQWTPRQSALCLAVRTALAALLYLFDTNP